jgi:hypothetical protein
MVELASESTDSCVTATPDPRHDLGGALLGRLVADPGREEQPGDG